MASPALGNVSDGVAGSVRAGVRAFLLGWGGHVLLRHAVSRLNAVLRWYGRHRSKRPHSVTPPRSSLGSRPAPDHDVAEEEEASPCSAAGTARNDDEADGPAAPHHPDSMLPYQATGRTQERPRQRGDRPPPSSSLASLLRGTLLHRESLRLGAFLATLTGGYRVIELALERLRGRKDGWNAFLAGAVAGLSIAIDTQERQKVVSLYVFFKACGLVWSSVTHRGVLPQGGGRWTVPQHIMWCLLCGTMMYCFFCEGELLDSFVYRFLYSCTSHHDQYAMSYVRKHALGMAGEDPSAKAQERLDYASGRLQSVPPPVVVKMREHFQPPIIRPHSQNTAASSLDPK